MNKIPLSFYLNADVVQVAKQLIGKYLCTCIDDELTIGKIVETEAYCGETDKACHAHFGMTKRNKVMFEQGGLAYIYLCYGIHHLFNVVTNSAGFADAVLIRAVEPVEGIEIMLKRRKMTQLTHRITAGPGSVAQALGITTNLYGTDLQGDTIWLAQQSQSIAESVIASPRVGVGYAAEDALLPWRFRIEGNKWCSKAK